MSKPLAFNQLTKRGDTFIEVLVAIAVFGLVAIIAITAMNLGVANAETSLELATTRTEINAQAEALRFLHSSYISEKTLPTYDGLTPEERDNREKYQQYAEVWEEVTNNAISADDLTLSYPPTTCEQLYDTTAGEMALARNKAFILNARNLLLGEPAITKSTSDIYISATAQSQKFQATPLNARIIYANASDEAQIEDADDSDRTLGEGNINVADRLYDRVLLAEGIWVIAVRSQATNNDGTPQFYDFYIETCWYGHNDNSPTTLDTVIRLYNPGDD